MGAGGEQHVLLLRKNCPTGAAEQIHHRQSGSSELSVLGGVQARTGAGGTPRSSPPLHGKNHPQTYPAPLSPKSHPFLLLGLCCPAPHPHLACFFCDAEWASSGRCFPVILCTQHHTLIALSLNIYNNFLLKQKHEKSQTN